MHANSPGLGSTDSVLPLAIRVPGVLAEAVVEVVCDIGAWKVELDSILYTIIKSWSLKYGHCLIDEGEFTCIVCHLDGPGPALDWSTFVGKGQMTW